MPRCQLPRHLVRKGRLVQHPGRLVAQQGGNFPGVAHRHPFDTGIEQGAPERRVGMADEFGRKAQFRRSVGRGGGLGFCRILPARARPVLADAPSESAFRLLTPYRR